tara:strand:- start:76 stop:309 length:234 start_codon:yes stop_codon:yes gene_type:complete
VTDTTRITNISEPRHSDVVADRSFEQTTGQPFAKQPPAQRKTTLKWDDNGELTSIDMARIIDRLTQPELNRCDLDTP